MVLQNGALFSGTIAQNLRWGNANATQEQLREACAIACADEFTDRFPDGYETVLEQNAANLSGGQKQRLRIARAIVKQPKILILDDSTSAVDMATDEHIRRALKRPCPAAQRSSSRQRIGLDPLVRQDHRTARGRALRRRHACGADGAQPDLSRRL